MKHTARIYWRKQSDELFTDRKYSRAHQWIFDGGAVLSASSSPEVVPVPMSDETAVDPEEALIASASSCHMLSFLAIAAARKFIVEEYLDNAIGVMGKDEYGKTAIVSITLSPRITFENSNVPSPEQLTQLHERSHAECYIANSIKPEIKIIS